MESGARGATVRRLLAFAGLYLGLMLPLRWLGSADPGSQGAAFAGPALGLVAAWVAGAVLIRTHGRSAGALGLAWSGATGGEILRGLGIGACAMGVPLLLLVAGGALRYRPDAGGPADLAAGMAVDFGFLAVAAMAEEALFRGYPFQLLAREFGPAFATVLTSAGFAAAHAGNPDVSGLALVNIFLAGLLLAAAYLRTRSLWFAAAVHVGWNWTVAVAADLPVSGLDIMDTPLYDPVLTGPGWLTGGTFGPEGGLAATLAAGLAILVVVRWDRVVETPAMKALRPLVDRDETGERVVSG
jgi:hypothetical protein